MKREEIFKGDTILSPYQYLIRLRSVFKNGENREDLCALWRLFLEEPQRMTCHFIMTATLYSLVASQVVGFAPYTICTKTLMCPCPFLTSSYPWNAAQLLYWQLSLLGGIDWLHLRPWALVILKKEPQTYLNYKEITAKNKPHPYLSLCTWMQFIFIFTF